MKKLPEKKSHYCLSKENCKGFTTEAALPQPSNNNQTKNLITATITIIKLIVLDLVWTDLV